jgi:hypothetical protein
MLEPQSESSYLSATLSSIIARLAHEAQDFLRKKTQSSSLLMEYAKPQALRSGGKMGFPLDVFHFRASHCTGRPHAPHS